MKIFFNLILIIIPITLFGFTDLGKWGETYEIKEKIDFKDTNSSLLSQKNIKKSINAAITSKIKLPTCKESKNRVMSFKRVLKEDINMPKFNIFIHKGTSFNPLEYKQFNKYLLMIDGSDENQTKLAKFYKNKSIVVVYNGSVLSLGRRVSPNVFIADKSFQDAFKVKCLPSFYIQENGNMTVKEIAIKDLTKSKEK